MTYYHTTKKDKKITLFSKNATYLKSSKGNIDEDITITNGGTNYIYPPLVSFSAPPAGGEYPVAVANLTGNAVSSIRVVSGGLKYINAPTITITPTFEYPETRVNMVSDSVGEITLLENEYGYCGFGYTTAPTIVIESTNGEGAGATATCTINSSGSVDSITLTNGGSGYTDTPIIRFVGFCTYSANAIVSKMKTKVQSIDLLTLGGGFTTAPTITLTGGGFTTQATATATIDANGEVDNITLTEKGAGYTGIPTVVFSGGTTTGANAAATCTVSGVRIFEYVFDIPPMELSRNAKIGLLSLASSVPANDENVYIVRCKEISSHDAWDNMLGWGVIYSQKSLNTNVNNVIYHSLGEQNLNRITLAISEDLMSRDTGIDSTIDFIITLNLIDVDDDEVQAKFMGKYKPQNQPPQTTGFFKLM